MKKPNWNRKLTRSLRTRDGVEMHTLRDAAEFAATVPANRAWQNQWQNVARALMAAAEGGDLYDATWSVYNALVLDLRFDFSTSPME